MKNERYTEEVFYLLAKIERYPFSLNIVFLKDDNFSDMNKTC